MSKYKSPFSVDHRNPMVISSRDPRAKNREFEQYLSRSGREIIIKKDDRKIQKIKNYPLSLESIENIPYGGEVSLSGDGFPGSIITAQTSGWLNAPTTISIFITTSTSGSPTSQDQVVSGASGSSCSYTISIDDTTDPVNKFRAFAIASNLSGYSEIVESTNIIEAVSSTAILAPTTAPVLSIYPNVEINGVIYNSEGYANTIDEEEYDIYNTATSWTTVNNSPTFYEWQIYANGSGTMSGTNFGNTGNILYATSSWRVVDNGSSASWRVRGGNTAGFGPWSNTIVI